MNEIVPDFKNVRQKLIDRIICGLGIPPYLLNQDLMTEHEWLSSTGPAAMLRFAQTEPKKFGLWAISDRKLRLFACACVRQVWDGTEPCPGNRAGPCCQTNLCPACQGTSRVGGLTDPRSRNAVEVAERYADGLAIESELVAAYNGAPRGDLWRTIRTVTGKLSCTPGLPVALLMQLGQDLQITPATQADMLRCIAGNPFRPWMRESAFIGDKSIPYPKPHIVWEAWLTYNDGVVVKLARVIYDERRWDLMPILADALEEAGCNEKAILAHCHGRVWCDRCSGLGKEDRTVRQMADPASPRTHVVRRMCLTCGGLGWRKPILPLPHARGCHVLDLLLGNK